jgi:hypothetical protein
MDAHDVSFEVRSNANLLAPRPRRNPARHRAGVSTGIACYPQSRAQTPFASFCAAAKCTASWALKQSSKRTYDAPPAIPGERCGCVSAGATRGASDPFRAASAQRGRVPRWHLRSARRSVATMLREHRRLA